MKKVKMLSFRDEKALLKMAFFALMLLFTFVVGLQEATAQVVQGPPPNWMSPAEANAVINNELEELGDDLAILPPGPAATSIDELMIIYDLISQNITHLNDVGESVYAAFSEAYGQVPVVYAEGGASPDTEAGSTIVYTPEVSDANSPKPTSPNYNGIYAKYEEVVDKLTF